MKLTEEQQIIVEENHNLIYWFCALRNLNVNDWYDLLALELCYAVMKYDSEKGSLANYFKIRAEGMIYKEFRKASAQKRYANMVEYIDNVPNVETDSDMQIALELKEILDGDHGEILKMKLAGYVQSETADKLGVSQSYVSKVIRKKKEEYDSD